MSPFGWFFEKMKSKKHMKILIINGQPRKEGLSSFLSMNYAKKKKKEGHEIKVVNVFDLNFDFIVENVHYPKNFESSLIESQKAIKWAEHIVFFYPIWWVSLPSLLKSFIERTFIPGFAYKYVNGKPQKLLKGKTAEVFSTSGGNKFYNSTIGKIDQYRTLGKTLWFCGIRLKKVKIFDSIRSNMSKEKIEILKKSIY